MTRRSPATLVATGLLLLLGTPLLWLAEGAGRTYGDPPAPAGSRPATETSTAPAAEPPAGGPAAEDPAGRSGATRVPVRSARLADRSPEPPAEPVRLRIPALGVDAPIVPVGVVEESGEMEIPADVHTIGWYRHGALPGAGRGSTVLTGHVDSRRQGPGALFGLADLPQGAAITVELTDATTMTYVATARGQYGKDLLPVGELFARDGDERLMLITCGGTFDAATRRYRDNVVVFAEPGPGQQ